MGSVITGPAQLVERRGRHVIGLLTSRNRTRVAVTSHGPPLLSRHSLPAQPETVCAVMEQDRFWFRGRGGVQSWSKARPVRGGCSRVSSLCWMVAVLLWPCSGRTGRVVVGRTAAGNRGDVFPAAGRAVEPGQHLGVWIGRWSGTTAVSAGAGFLLERVRCEGQSARCLGSARSGAATVCRFGEAP